MINEGFYLSYQAFEDLKSQKFESVTEELQNYTRVKEVLESLQKCIFLCKDNKEVDEGEDNKFSKLNNLILCLKLKNEVITEESLESTSD